MSRFLNSIALALLVVNFALSFLFHPIKEVVNWNANKLKLLLGFVLCYLTLAISTFLNYSEEGLHKLFYYTAFWIIPTVMLLSNYTLDMQRFRQHIKAFSYTVTFAAFVLLLIAVYRGFWLPEQINHWYFSYQMLAEPFGFQPIYLSLIFSVAIFFTLFFLLPNVNRKKEVVFYLLLLLIEVVTVFLLSARTSIIVVLFLFLGYFLFVIKSLKYKIIAVLLGASLVLTIVQSNKVLRQRLLEIVDYKTAKYGGLSLRIQKWSYALETFQQRKLLGYGLVNGNEALYNTYQRHNFELGIKHRYNAHNMYLQLLLYVGVIGILVFVYLVYLLVPWKRNYKLLMLGFLGIMLFNALTESILDRQWGLFTFVFFSTFIYLFQVNSLALKAK